MGWFSSIHVKTNDAEGIIACLQQQGESRCFVGRSGAQWVGVYSGKCEASGGLEISAIASRLSSCAKDAYVLGIHASEDAFSYWLFANGKLRDQYPRRRPLGFFTKNHEILNLSASSAQRQQIEAALIEKEPVQPAKAVGLTEEQFVAKAYGDMERLKTLPPEERERLRREYSKLRSSRSDDLGMLCDALGIKHYAWNYSDLVEGYADQASLRGADLRHLQ